MTEHLDLASLHPLENPVRGQLLRESVSIASIGVLFLVLALVTAVTQLFALYLGTPALHTLTPWGVLGLLCLVTCFVFRPAVLKNRKRLFLRSAFVQGALQLLWIHVLAWSLPDEMAVIAAGLLFGFVVSWSFLDSMQFYNTTFARLTYLFGFLLFPLYLLVGLWLNLPGVGTIENVSQRTVQFLFLQAIMLLMSLSILSVLGNMIRESDQKLLQEQHLRKANEALRAERQILNRVSQVLSGSVAHRRFQHDVASPLGSIPLNLMTLRERLQNPDEEALELLDDLEVAAASSIAMLQAARSESQHPLSSTPIDDLVDQVQAEWRRGLRGHNIADALPPEIQLDSAEVFINGEHPACLSSLCINGTLQAPKAALQIRGAPCSTMFYRLQIRDHGVPPEEQEAALKRVQDGLSLRTFGSQSRSSGYRGMGIGLPLCKLQITQSGGWVGARKPASGRGLELVVILPRVHPDQLPDEVNIPEQFVAPAHVRS